MFLESTPNWTCAASTPPLPPCRARYESVATDFLLGRSQPVRIVSCAWPAGQLEGPMSLLVDNQIRDRIADTSSLATDVVLKDFAGSDSKIQAASLDLTVGEIFIPGTDPNKPGGVNSPKQDHALRTGQTAVIVTKEELHLGDDLAGVGLPPASLSLKGLLMTNPGHIDPGYCGRLHLTVINMSRISFPLKRGDRIIRVVFIALAGTPSAAYNNRHPGASGPIITAQLLDDLSADFVDVERRSKKIAKRAVRNAGILATIVSLLIPFFVCLLTV